MASPQQKRWTVEDYLAYETETDVKHEYYYGEVYAMAGGSRNHIVISGNVFGAFHRQLLEHPCVTYQSEMKIKVNPSVYFYPDVAVTCSEELLENDMLLNPTVIVEVLSPSTEAFDRGRKFDEYRTIDSLQDYLLVSQDKHRIAHYVRKDSYWVLIDYIGVEAQVELKSIGCVLTLADVYQRVNLASSDDDTI